MENLLKVFDSSKKTSSFLDQEILDILKDAFKKKELHFGNINDISPGGFPLICYCCDNNWIESLRFLVENGADINNPCAKGFISIHYCSDNSPECAKYLIQNGVNINYCSKDERYSTPLIYYALFGSKTGRQHIDLTEMLINHGADINAKNPCGYTAVRCSCELQKLELTKMLIKYGAILDENIKHRCEMDERLEDLKKLLSVYPFSDSTIQQKIREHTFYEKLRKYIRSNPKPEGNYFKDVWDKISLKESEKVLRQRKTHKFIEC